MTTYRTGNHWGVTIVREPSPARNSPCGHDWPYDPGHDLCAQLVAVVVNGDQALAERICELLNAEPAEAHDGGPRSHLGDRVVMDGPYTEDFLTPDWMGSNGATALALNELRAELIALRKIATGA